MHLLVQFACTLTLLLSMRLTRFSDFGLRVLIYLSRAGERHAPVTVAEIALQFDIPVNHLVKVVGHLARAGWIQATRGRNGGVRLCVDPSVLQVGTILRELEGDAELADCEGQGCRLSQDCRLRGALKAGLQAFYDAMNAYTLLDITKGTTGQQIMRMHRSFVSQSSA
ncbi:MAG: Rrf2 family transcriptional regulator [Pseudomonadota bacterium]